MSIQNEINRINENIASTYSALSDMGATMPETQNSANMASTVRTIPQSGSGDTVEEVAYVDALFDFSTFSVVSIDKTYAEIVEMIEAGKYVVARGKYALVASPVNVAYFPLSAWVKEENSLLFTGMMAADLGNGSVILSLSMKISDSNYIFVKARVVSTTDLN